MAHEVKYTTRRALPMAELKQWEQAATQLGDARRNGRMAEAMLLDRRVSRLERTITACIFKLAFPPKTRKRPHRAQSISIRHPLTTKR